MRLFIAINLNDEMKSALLDMQDSMRGLGVRGNYTRQENMHLTVAFIGEYPDPYPVLDILDNIDFEPFEIRLGETGAFHRLWWAGIEQSRPLDSLVRQVRHSLADAGIPFDRKKFSPHITLIRNPQSRNGLTFRDVVREPEKVSMLVDHISLMRSDRGKNGVVYTEIE